MECLNEFQHEAEFQLKMQHPNLVKLLGICTHPMALVIELMSKGDTHGLILNYNVDITWPMKIRMAMDAALGLQYMHGTIFSTLLELICT